MATDIGLPPRPRTADMERALRFMRPFRWLASPVLVGLERLPERGPMLLVGNHSLFGILDAPILYIELYARRRLVIRFLGDRLHAHVPRWWRVVERYGTVVGTQENCAALLKAGEVVMVFPGGAREVSKRKGEKYRLVWGDRIGFARAAIRERVPVVPVSFVGVEDAFDILFDADEILSSPLGRIVDRLGFRRDLVMPIVRGLGPTPLPRLERQYFCFGDPIDAGAYLPSREADLDATARALRDAVRVAIEDGIARLLRERDADPHRSFAARARAALLGGG